VLLCPLNVGIQVSWSHRSPVAAYPRPHRLSAYRVRPLLNPLASWGESKSPPDHAREFLKAGTVGLGLVGGFWQAEEFVNHPPSTDPSAVFGPPKIGMNVPNELRAGLLNENIELAVEPLFARLTKPFSAKAAGRALVLTYNVQSFGRWVSFWDTGAGMLWTNLAPRIPEQSTSFNFVLETGPRVHYFLTKSITLTPGVRHHHISNMGFGQRDTGVNAALPYFGLSWFFPR
jgi:lipid A 3-O-deacylase